MVEDTMGGGEGEASQWMVERYTSQHKYQWKTILYSSQGR